MTAARTAARTAVAEKRSGKHIRQHRLLTFDVWSSFKIQHLAPQRAAPDNTAGSTAGGDKGDSEEGTNQTETEGVGVKRPMPDRWDEMTRNQRKNWRKQHWR